MRMVLTADWQMGMKATRVAGVADCVRTTRLESAARTVNKREVVRWVCSPNPYSAMDNASLSSRGRQQPHTSGAVRNAFGVRPAIASE
jgi:hypothetical protein